MGLNAQHVVAAMAATSILAGALAVKVAWDRFLERTRIRHSQSGAPMPGPPCVFLLGNLPELLRDGRGHISQVGNRWREKYGPLVQAYLTAIPVVVALEPDLARRVMALYERPAVFITDYVTAGGKGVIFSRGEYQRQHRRAIVQLMNEALYRAVAKETVYSTTRILRPALDRAAETGEPCDSRLPVLRTAVNVLMLTCMSRDLTEDAGPPPGGVTTEQYSAAFGRVTQGISGYLKAPLPFWRYFKTAAFRELDAALETLRRYEEAVVRERRGRRAAGEPPRGDALDQLLDSQPAGGTMEEVCLDVRDFIAAGHETTSATVTFCLALFARFPEAQAAVRAEVDAVLGGRPPSFEDLRGLQLLEGAFKETIRMYPPAHQLLRESPPGGIDLAGYRIPEGHWIMFSAWQLGRIPEAFPDPERFEPVRWLGENEARDRAWAPFGGGPRLCAGQRFAFTEFKTMLALLLQRYEILPAPPGTPNPVPILSASARAGDDCGFRCRRRGPPAL